MKDQLQKLYPHKDRLVMAAIFSIFAMVVGVIIPIIYRTYFDKTQYYTLVQPVEIENSIIARCSDVVLIMRRTSLANYSANFTYELSMITKDGSNPVAHFKTDDAVVDEGSEVIYKHLPISCDAPTGTYYISGLVDYTIDRTPKTYNFYTYKFEVVE